MTSVVQNGADGVPRYLTFPLGEPVKGLASLPPRAQADDFLRSRGALLALPAGTLAGLSKPPASWPEPDFNELRAETQKHVMDS